MQIQVFLACLVIICKVLNKPLLLHDTISVVLNPRPRVSIMLQKKLESRCQLHEFQYDFLPSKKKIIKSVMA